MTKIAFEISKNITACLTDANVPLMDDSTAHADTKAELWLNGELVMWHAVTDEGGYVEYTTDFAVGDHTLEIRSNRGDSADIHIDRMLIDDQHVMPAQYDVRQVIFDQQSPAKWKLVEPHVQCKQENYVWWGEVYSDDEVMLGTHYRPHLISDLGWNWRWYFTVKADGTLHWAHTPDVNDPFYDSTQNNSYYMAPITQGMSPLVVADHLSESYISLYAEAGISSDDDSTQSSMQLAYVSTAPDTPYGSEWMMVGDDSSSSYGILQRGQTITVGVWQGPGIYTEDLMWVNGGSQEQDLLTDVFVENFTKYCRMVVNKWYHASYPITPITVTTS